MFPGWGGAGVEKMDNIVLSSEDLSVGDKARHIERVYDFEIPSQSLDSALRDFGRITGQPVLYRSEIMKRQISSPVQGRYTREDALRLMLLGTGLTQERYSQDAESIFVLKINTSSSRISKEDLDNLAGYPALLQASVWGALCSDPLTRPGDYRALIRFRIDTRGRVRHVHLLGSTGNSVRDEAIRQRIGDAFTELAPPPDMPQPIILLIQQREVNPHCKPLRYGTRDER